MCNPMCLCATLSPLRLLCCCASRQICLSVHNLFERTPNHKNNFAPACISTLAAAIRDFLLWNPALQLSSGHLFFLHLLYSPPLAIGAEQDTNSPSTSTCVVHRKHCLVFIYCCLRTLKPWQAQSHHLSHIQHKRAFKPKKNPIP